MLRMLFTIKKQPILLEMQKLASDLNNILPLGNLIHDIADILLIDIHDNHPY